LTGDWKSIRRAKWWLDTYGAEVFCWVLSYLKERMQDYDDPLDKPGAWFEWRMQKETEGRRPCCEPEPPEPANTDHVDTTRPVLDPNPPTAQPEESTPHDPQTTESHGSAVGSDPPEQPEEEAAIDVKGILKGLRWVYTGRGLAALLCQAKAILGPQADPQGVWHAFVDENENENVNESDLVETEFLPWIGFRLKERQEPQAAVEYVAEAVSIDRAS